MRSMAISRPKSPNGRRSSRTPTSALRNSEWDNPHPFAFGLKAGKNLTHRPLARDAGFTRRIKALRHLSGQNDATLHDPSAQALRQILRLPNERLRFPSYGGHARARGL